MTAAPHPLPLASCQEEGQPDPARYSSPLVAISIDLGVCFRVSVKHLALIVVDDVKYNKSQTFIDIVAQ